jgi:hypothetical protein
MKLLFESTENGTLHGVWRRKAIATIHANHYLHSVPSGKSHYIGFDGAYVVWSIPPNCNISTFLVGKPNVVWELSRMWAPDGHRKNLLTQAIAFSVKQLRIAEPQCAAVVSYADPNVGHHGGIYLAASWIQCGTCEETRYYVTATGQTVSRRSFHSGDKRLTTAEVLSRGVQELHRPGKLRFAFPLRPWARKELLRRFSFLQNRVESP